MRAMHTSLVRAARAAPERLLAFYSDHNVVDLGDKHRFPMAKYLATRMALANDASLVDKIELLEAPAADLEDVCAVHDPAYVQAFATGQLTPEAMRGVGFPWSPQLVARTFSSAGGTVAATHAVLGGGRPMAANVAGGTHHAFSDRGEGFCVFNDIAIAAAVALRDYPAAVERVLVVDLDVHQGNGTSGIFADEPRVVTFDVHGAGNYPWRTRQRSTYDVPLPDGAGDEQVLGLLQEWLPRLVKDHQPQLTFYQAGVDALAGDSFGRLAMSREGLNKRNNMVYSCALEHGIPLVVCMGGGYTRPMDASVASHTDVYRTAAYRHHAAVLAARLGAGAAGAA